MVAPSIMIALAAFSVCVRGKKLERVITHSGDPSKEKNIPDKVIIGQVIRLSNPPASSSLETLEAISKPMEMISRS